MIDDGKDMSKFTTNTVMMMIIAVILGLTIIISVMIPMIYDSMDEEDQPVVEEGDYTIVLRPNTDWSYTVTTTAVSDVTITFTGSAMSSGSSSGLVVTGSDTVKGQFSSEGVYWLYVTASSHHPEQSVQQSVKIYVYYEPQDTTLYYSLLMLVPAMCLIGLVIALVTRFNKGKNDMEDNDYDYSG